MRTHTEESLAEEQFISLCEATIPSTEIQRIDECLASAGERSQQGFAAEFPQTAEGERRLRLSIMASWLHSRDLECVMRILGYAIDGAGIHDLEEYVDGAEVKARIRGKVANGAKYSDWLLRWIDSLSAGEPVNVSCLNPSLVVGMWQWRPGAGIRQSAHKKGS